MHPIVKYMEIKQSIDMMPDSLGHDFQVYQFFTRETLIIMSIVQARLGGLFFYSQIMNVCLYCDLSSLSLTIVEALSQMGKYWYI